MPHSLLISYLGDNRPGLISQFLNHISNLEGNIDDITFASLGRSAEMTFIYRTSIDVDPDGLETELRSLPAASNSKISVQPHLSDLERGPSHRITHRIILNGSDKPGLLNEFVSSFDEHGAIIVRMNAESIQGKSGTQFIARFAVAIRAERAPNCLSAIVKVAGERNLTFRYETA